MIITREATATTIIHPLWKSLQSQISRGTSKGAYVLFSDLCTLVHFCFLSERISTRKNSVAGGSEQTAFANQCQEDRT